MRKSTVNRRLQCDDKAFGTEQIHTDWRRVVVYVDSQQGKIIGIGSIDQICCFIKASALARYA